jgi:hypothetical protein
VAIVHRRVQLLLVGHLDWIGLLGGGSTVAWGGSGDLVRLHLVACARTRSARDGRWPPSLPWGGRGCIARHQGSAQGECKQGELSRPRGRRPHEAEARPRRDRRRRGAGQHCAVGRRHWGPVEGYCTAGEGRGRGGTRGEANKVSRAPERLGWRPVQVRVRLGWRCAQVRWRLRSDGGARRLGFRLGWRCAAQFSVAMQRRLGWRSRS